METQPVQVQSVSPPFFPFKPWLLWFFTLLVPFAFIVFLLIIVNQGLFEWVYVFSFVTFVFVIPFAILAAIPQWIYLRRKVRRASFWFLIQLLIYGMIVFLFSFIFNAQVFLLSRNFVWWARVFSFTLILLIFLLPGALMRFEFLRARKVPVGWGWFRDYALVFALSLAVFLIYDWFMEGRASPIPGLHGALYTGMITFFLCLAAGEAWVLARVPFPGLPKKVKKRKTTEVVTAQKDQNQEGKNEESESVT